MIRLTSVSDAQDLDNDLKHIYLDSFPDDERREWKDMQELIRHPYFNVYKITDDRLMVGLITIWKWPDLLFIEHFALKETLRGKGIGTHVLKQIMDKTSSRIIVEVEEPDSEQACRRIVFYQRLGFNLCLQDYYQPPYLSGNDKVKMLVMSYPQQLTDEEFIVIKKQIYKEVYKWDNYMDFP